MKLGTRSVLFGVHNPLWHGPLVWLAYYQLYGREAFSLPIIAACFLHDVGYWGKNDTDGAEGKAHPERGAKLMHFLFDEPTDEWIFGPLYLTPESWHWYNFTVCHSRDYAKTLGQPYSKLAVADKLAIALMPRWFYILVASLSGELGGYVAMYPIKGLSRWGWLTSIQRKMRIWSWEHRDVSKQERIAA